MSDELERSDEVIADLPDAGVTDQRAKEVKGGATSVQPVSTIPTAPTPTPPGIHFVPKTIDPCW